MTRIHSRLLMGLAICCFLSAGPIVQASETITVHVVVAMPSPSPAVVPQNPDSFVINHNGRIPRIDPVDFPRKSVADESEFTQTQATASGTEMTDGAPVHLGRAPDGPFAGPQPLRLLVLIQASDGSGSSVSESAGGISTQYLLSIDVSVAKRAPQPARVAQNLPRAVYVVATPDKNETQGSVKPPFEFALERQSEAGAIGAFDLSTAMSLKTLPDLGIAQPLPDH